MSKMNELDLCVNELRNAAESLNAVAYNLTALFNNNGVNIFTQHGNDNNQIGCVESESKPVTLEQVRAVLAEKSRAGHTAEVRGLLESHGANKLSEINRDEYESLLHEAEAIGNE